MEVRQLEVFVAVATMLHLERAAEKLHMEQPALSGLIRQLERDGTRLSFRITRRIELTNAGSELLAHSD